VVTVAGTYEKTTSVHLGVTIHGTKLTAMVLLAAGIRPEYSTSAEKFVQGPLEPKTKDRRAQTGKYSIIGVVVDAAGDPLTGVAVLVGDDVLFSGRDGRFEASRKKKNASQSLVSPVM
jgi:hypothetical protein